MTVFQGCTLKALARSCATTVEQACTLIHHARQHVWSVHPVSLRRTTDRQVAATARVVSTQTARLPHSAHPVSRVLQCFRQSRVASNPATVTNVKQAIFQMNTLRPSAQSAQQVSLLQLQGTQTVKFACEGSMPKPMVQQHAQTVPLAPLQLETWQLTVIIARPGDMRTQTVRMRAMTALVVSTLLRWVCRCA